MYSTLVIFIVESHHDTSSVLYSIAARIAHRLYSGVCAMIGFSRFSSSISAVTDAPVSRSTNISAERWWGQSWRLGDDSVVSYRILRSSDRQKQAVKKRKKHEAEEENSPVKSHWFSALLMFPSY